jgi:membrane-bound lytic murein transglycosylase A
MREVTSSPSALQPLSRADWPLIEDDMDMDSLAQAAAQSLAYLNSTAKERIFQYGGQSFRGAELAAAWARVLDLRRDNPDPRRLTEALQQEFDLFQAEGLDSQGQVLFTGYYEPISDGRLLPEGSFQWPLYPRPDDLVTVDLSLFAADLPARRLVGRIRNNQLQPYPDREAIDFQGALAGQARPLAYLDDPVEAFFLHIQGSGLIKLADGSLIRLGYAAVNGRPYRSIGALLLAEGAMNREEMSMQGIRAYLRRHPQEVQRILSANPSYVFFRRLSPEGGPIGAYNRPLTGGRSVAYDNSLFPPMGLAYIRTWQPETNDGQKLPLNRLVWGQDTGGAIKGPGRVDLFCGSGPQAGELAGRMRQPGRIYFLLPKR